MTALQSAQHEAAAALIVPGARLELTNCHGRTAADLATGLPDWLHKGLLGDATECERVCAMALDYVHFSC